MELENVVARLAQHVERRYYGKYRALVVENGDPEQLGRIKAQVPSVLGEDVVTGWAMPCVPYGGGENRGFLFVPQVGDGVWIEFEEGDLEFPIWVGTFWSKPGGASELPTPSDEEGAEEDSVQDPPTRKTIKTVQGHTIQFEDADGEVRIVITDGQNENRIVFGESGLSVVNKDNAVLMTDDGIVIEDANGNSLTKDSSGIVIADVSGNEVIMEAGGIKVGSSSAAEPLVLGNQLMSLLSSFAITLATHTHVGNMGAPTSPPTAPIQLDITPALSLKHKVE